MTTAGATDPRRGRSRRPRLHPLDLPREIAPARRWYLTGLALQQVASPRVLVGTCFLLMAVSDNPVTPLLGPWVGLALVCYVERRCFSDAWAYIPRREQDAGRPAPSLWVGFGALAQTSVLICGVTVYLVMTSGAARFPGGPVAIGLAVALAVREFAISVSSPEPDAGGGGPRTAALSVAGLIAFATCLAGAVVPAAHALAAPFDPWQFAIGLLTPITAAAVWRMLRRIPERVRCLPFRLDPA